MWQFFHSAARARSLDGDGDIRVVLPVSIAAYYSARRLEAVGMPVYQYDFADDEATPKSLWFGEKYDASSKGTNLLESIIPNNPFDFPKSLYTVEDNIIIGADGNSLVLDYFAGSGTTGHAIY